MVARYMPPRGLSAEQERAMVADYLGGMLQAEVAKKYNVSRTTTQRIMRRHNAKISLAESTVRSRRKTTDKGAAELTRRHARVVQREEENESLHARIAADQARLREAQQRALDEHRAKYGQRLRPLEEMVA